MTQPNRLGVTKEQPVAPTNIRVAADLCHQTHCISADTQNKEVFAIFDSDASLRSLPVVDGQKIVGLINRDRFMSSMAKPFHWELYSKKRCTKMMDDNPVVVDADLAIHDVANLLLGNGDGDRGSLSDGFVVARGGVLLGTGYTRDVLATLLDHEREASAELRDHHERLSEIVEERTRDLTRAKQVAEHANRAKSEFLTNMSHELRTPLHAVLAFAEFGTQKSAEGPRDKLAQYFARIHESAERLTRLVNDLLDLSKLEADKVELKFSPIDLCQLADRALTEFGALAAQRNIELRIEKNVASAPMICDGPRIVQVLANILGNALKFSIEGSCVRLFLGPIHRESISHEGAPTGYRLQVFDKGPGIPEQELEDIFERFTQSSNTRTGAGGTGLGLPISREIIRLHKGHIRASNNPDGGACFTIELPVG